MPLINSKEISLTSQSVQCERIALKFNPHRRSESSKQQLDTSNNDEQIQLIPKSPDNVPYSNSIFQLNRSPIKRLYHEVSEPPVNYCNNKFENTMENSFQQMQMHSNESTSMYPHTASRSNLNQKPINQSRSYSPDKNDATNKSEASKFRNVFNNRQARTPSTVTCNSEKSNPILDRRSSGHRFNPMLNDKTERLKYLESKKKRQPVVEECSTLKEFTKKSSENGKANNNPFNNKDRDRNRDRNRDNRESRNRQSTPNLTERKTEKQRDNSSTIHPRRKSYYSETAGMKSDLKSPLPNSHTVCNTPLDKMYRSTNYNGNINNITGFKIPKKHSNNDTRDLFKIWDEAPTVLLNASFNKWKNSNRENPKNSNKNNKYSTTDLQQNSCTAETSSVPEENTPDFDELINSSVQNKDPSKLDTVDLTEINEVMSSPSKSIEVVEIDDSDEALSETILIGDWKVIDEINQSSEELETPTLKEIENEKSKPNSKRPPPEKIIRRGIVISDYTEDGCDLSTHNIIEGKRRTRKCINLNEHVLEAEQIRKVKSIGEKPEPKPVPVPVQKSRSSQKSEKKKSKKSISLKTEPSTNTTECANGNDDSSESEEKVPSDNTKATGSVNKKHKTEKPDEADENELYEGYLKQLREHNHDSSSVLEILANMLKSQNLTESQFKNALNIITNAKSDEQNCDENSSENGKSDSSPNEGNVENVRPLSSLKRNVRHKTELDRLNDDIRNMFICNDVLMASGRRLCTISKPKPLQPTPPVTQVLKRRPTSGSKKQLPLVPLKESKILPKLKKARVIVTRCPLIAKMMSKEYKEKQRKSRLKKIKPCPRSKKTFKYESDSDNDKTISKSIASFFSDDSINMPVLKPMKEITELKKQEVPYFNQLNVDPNFHYFSKYGTVCVLCRKKFKHIAEHYIMAHNNSEVYPSRLAPQILAFIKENQFNKPTNCIDTPNGKIYKYRCPFCSFENSSSLKQWIRHMTNHTGEFSFKCSECYRHSNKKKDIENHIALCCPIANIIKQKSINVENERINAYICTLCDYVQLVKENIVKHLSIHHLRTEFSTISRIPLINLEKLKPNDVTEKPVSESDNSNAVIFESESDSESDSEPDWEPDSKSDSKSDSESESDSELVSESVSKSETETDESEPISIPEPNPIPNSTELNNSNAFVSSVTNDANLGGVETSYELLNDVSESFSGPLMTSIAERLSQRFRNLNKKPSRPNTPVDKVTPENVTQNKSLELPTSSPSPLYMTSIPKDNAHFSNYNASKTRNTASGTNLESGTNKHAAKNQSLLNRLASRLQTSDALNTQPKALNAASSSQCSETEDQRNSIDIDTQNKSKESPPTQTNSIKNATSNPKDVIEIEDDDNWIDIEVEDETDGSSTKCRNYTIKNPLSLLISNAKLSSSNRKQKITKRKPSINKSVDKPHTNNILSNILSTVSSNAAATSNQQGSLKMTPLQTNDNDLQSKATAVPVNSGSLSVEIQNHDISSILDTIDYEPTDINLNSPPLFMISDVTDVGEVLNESSKVSPTPNTFTKYRISNLGYSMKENEIRYHCFVNGCTFLYSELSVGLQNHYVAEHKELNWDGYCHTCKAHVCCDYNMTLSRELNHIVEVHGKKNEPNIVSNNLKVNDKTNIMPPKITLRKLSGDKLSKQIEYISQSKSTIENVAIPTDSLTKSNQNSSEQNIDAALYEQLHHELGLSFVDEIDLTIEPATSSLADGVSVHSSKHPFLKINKVESLNAKTKEIPTSSLRISEVVSLSFQDLNNRTANVLGDIPAINRQILSSKPSKYPPRLPLSKLPMHLKSQLTEKALLHKFKCMDDQCAFTAPYMKTFFEHLKKHHLAEQNHNTSWRQCPYCDYHAQSLADYLFHVSNFHKWDIYQCPYCFYRTSVDCNVEIHLTCSHPTEKKLILVGEKEGEKPEVNLKELELLQLKNVKEIICIGCPEKFYVLKNFHVHIKMHRPNSKYYECAFCHNLISTDYQTLKSHLLLAHQIGCYDCIYCDYAAYELNDMIIHVAHNHPSNEFYTSTRLFSNTENTTLKDTCGDTCDIPSLVSLIRQLDPSTEKKIVDKEERENPGKNIRPSPYSKQISTAFLRNDRGASSSPNSQQVVGLKTSTIRAPTSSNFQQSNSLSPISKQSTSTESTSLAYLSKPTTSSASSSLATTSKQSTSTESTSLAGPSKLTTSSASSLATTSKQSTSTESTSLAATSKQTISSPSFSLAATSKQSTSLESTTLSATSTKPLDQLLRLSVSQPSTKDCTKQQMVKTLIELVAHTGIHPDILYRCVYPNCKMILSDEIYLAHLFHHNSCGENISSFPCNYCSNAYKNANALKSHLRYHARHQYFCYFCNKTAKTHQQQVKHINETHSQAIQPISFPITSDNQFFVTGPPTLARSKIIDFYHNLIADWKCKKSQLKKVFNPNEIDQLPIQPIFVNEIFCAICHYKTKVKTNMIRHLNMHSKEEFAAPIDPINPVPRLNTVNREETAISENVVDSLSSQITNAIKPNVDIPKYIPQMNRYVCGAEGCQYQSISFNMLRCHLSTLHSTEKSYQCPHCKLEICKRSFSLERIIQHLRFHDAKIFQCEDCNYLHYQRHVVVRHIRESHKGVSVSLLTYDRSIIDKGVKVFRTVIVDTDGSSNDVTTPNDTAPILCDLLKNSSSPKCYNKMKWLCNICKHQTQTYNQMISHTSKQHKCKNKFQCFHCMFSAPQLAHIMDHINENHPTKVREAKCIFNRVNEIEEEKAADTRPLWIRNDPSRVRHIRGILMEDEEESKLNAEKMAADNIGDDDESQIDEDDENRLAGGNNLISAIEVMSKINFLCFYCDYVFKSFEEVKEHWTKNHWLNTTQGHIPDVPFLFKIDGKMLCAYCKSFNGSRKQIFSHCEAEHPRLEMAIADPNKPNECAYCDYVWSDLEDLLKHADSKHKPMNIKDFNFACLKEVLALGECQEFLQCYYCGQLCADKCNIMHHERVSHQNENLKCLRYKQIKDEIIYLCQFCEYSSTNEMATIRHMIDHYPKFKECSNCLEKFKNFSEYIKHVRQHHESVIKKFTSHFNENTMESFFAQIFVLFPNGFTAPKYSLAQTPYGWNDKLPAIFAEMHRRINLGDGTEKNLTPPRIIANSQKQLKRRRKTITTPITHFIKSNNDEYNPENHPETKRLRLSPPENLEDSTFFSFYGKIPEPIDLSKITTTTHFGGSTIPVTCDRFSLLFNIDAKVVLEKINIPKNGENMVFVKQTKPCPASKKFQYLNKT